MDHKYQPRRPSGEYVYLYQPARSVALAAVWPSSMRRRAVVLAVAVLGLLSGLAAFVLIA